jgi:hypothetical protein
VIYAHEVESTKMLDFRTIDAPVQPNAMTHPLTEDSMNGVQIVCLLSATNPISKYLLMTGFGSFTCKCMEILPKRRKIGDNAGMCVCVYVCMSP